MSLFMSLEDISRRQGVPPRQEKETSMRLPVHQQREIARLHFHSPNSSSRAIGRATGTSAGAVHSLRKKIRKSERTFLELEALDDDEWLQVFDKNHKTNFVRKEEPDWSEIHEQMHTPDATREQLWREWKAKVPNGIQYSAFTENYRRWLGKQRLVMRQIHAPADKLYVDFAGRKIAIRDQQSGEVRQANLFVAVMGCSNYTYLEAVWAQSTECWVQAHSNAFEFFGGSTKWVVSDNLKAAVWRREKDRIVINPGYRDCLRHYASAALPTKPRSPRQNAKAEAGVQIAQRWVLFALRNRVFFSLEECNVEILRLNEELNTRPFKKIGGCRRSRFEQYDLPALQALPVTRHEVCNWRYNVKVGDDYLAEHQKCFYSVPWTHRGFHVDLRYTNSTIEIFHHNRRLTTHELLSVPGSISRRDEHMPPAHKTMLDGEPKALLNWARTVGTSTEKMLTHHVLERYDLTNGLKAARKLRELARLYGETRFEVVCAYALSLNIFALKSIASILKQNAETKISTTAPASVKGIRPAHSDVRGAEYFGGE